jgi:hypothetical protein
VVLQTYQEMLESRQAVLEWLMQDQANTPVEIHKAS